MTTNAAIGAKLRERRKHMGLTQAKAAVQIDMSRSHLANIEAGRVPIGRENLIKLARLLGLSLDFVTADPPARETAA